MLARPFPATFLTRYVSDTLRWHQVKALEVGPKGIFSGVQFTMEVIEKDNELREN